MDKKMKAMSIAGLTMLSTGLVSAQVTQVTQQICNVLTDIRIVLYVAAAAVGALVLTLQGIKWAASADDPGARKQAKEGIIHAIVGLIVVIVAVSLVLMVFGANAHCPL
jgi:hypothetical protein